MGEHRALNRGRTRGIRCLAALSAAILLAVSLAATDGEVVTGACIDVVSGDTLEMQTDSGSLIIHLWGIEAPELEQPFGPESQRFLIENALGQTFDIEIRHRLDDRDVARVRSSEGDLAKRLIAAGYAWLSLSSSTSDDYATALFIARTQKAGMWADGAADLVHPTKWIAGRQPTPTSTPTPTPASLSAIASSVKLADDGRAGPITDLDLASGGLSLPDSDYSRCVLPVVREMEGAVKIIRHFTQERRFPVDQGDLIQLRHTQGLLSSDGEFTRRLGRCRPGYADREGHRELEKAASLYQEGGDEVFEDIAMAWNLFNAGDVKMRNANAAFKRTYADKARREAEANEGRKWYPR